MAQGSMVRQAGLMPEPTAAEKIVLGIKTFPFWGKGQPTGSTHTEPLLWFKGTISYLIEDAAERIQKGDV